MQLKAYLTPARTGPHHSTLVCAYDLGVIWLHTTAGLEGRRYWPHDIHQDVHLAAKLLHIITRLRLHYKDKKKRSV